MMTKLKNQRKSRTTAEVAVQLTKTQEKTLADLIEKSRKQNEMLIGSIVSSRSKLFMTYRSMPAKTADQIIALVDQHYDTVLDAEEIA